MKPTSSVIIDQLTALNALTDDELQALPTSEIFAFLAVVGGIAGQPAVGDPSYAIINTAYTRFAAELDARIAPRKNSSVKKIADQAFNSVVPANVTNLLFPLVAGRYYHFKFVCLVQSDTATVGVGLTVTVPAATRFGAKGSSLISADGTGSEYNGAITASADAVVPTAVPTTNTDYIWVLEGLVVPSANGNLQLQARTETGTTNVIVRQGSIGLLWDFGT